MLASLPTVYRPASAQQKMTWTELQAKLEDPSHESRPRQRDSFDGDQVEEEMMVRKVTSISRGSCIEGALVTPVLSGATMTPVLSTKLADFQESVSIRRARLSMLESGQTNAVSKTDPAGVWHVERRPRLRKTGTKVLTSTSEERKAKLQRKMFEKQRNTERLAAFAAIPDSEIGPISAAFASCDKRGEGELRLDDVMACLQTLALSGTNAKERSEIRDLVADCVHRVATERPKLPQAGDEQRETTAVVDIIEFTLDVIPQVKELLLLLNGNELLRHFCNFDRQGMGLITTAQCGEIGRGLGYDPTTIAEMFAELYVRGELAKSCSEVDADVCQKVLAMAKRVSELKTMEALNNIKGELMSESLFDEFKEDIVKYHAVFKQQCHGRGVIHMDQIRACVRKVGLMPPSAEGQEFLDDLIDRFPHEHMKDVFMRQLGSANHQDFYADASAAGKLELIFDDFLRFMKFVRDYHQEHKRDYLVSFFNEYDADHSGTLDMREISTLLARMGCLPRTKQEQAEIMQVIQFVDADKSGFLDVDEFQELNNRMEERLNGIRYEEEVSHGLELGFTEQQLSAFRRIFEAIDLDFSGTLDQYELKVSLNLMGLRISSEVFERMFNVFDADHNGTFDFKEFVEFMHLIWDTPGLMDPSLGPSDWMPTQIRLLPEHVLRKVLECRNFPRSATWDMGKNELITLVCDCLKVYPDENFSKLLQVSTEAELYDCASRGQKKTDDAAADRRAGRATPDFSLGARGESFSRDRDMRIRSRDSAK